MVIMDIDERENNPTDFYGSEPEHECSIGCGNEVNEDPAIIDGEIYCDICASEIQQINIQHLAAKLAGYK